MKNEILWIDDNSERKSMSNHLGQISKSDVDFVCVDGINFNEKLAEILSGEEPSCVLIDHVLNKVKKDDLQIEKGSTVAAMMREKWTACPIVGVTAAPNLKDIDSERLAYDELVNFDEFEEYVPYVENLIRGFQELGAVRDCDELFALLGVPECEKEAIYSCLPEELKAENLKKNFVSRAYHWIRTNFYLRPGFLYDAAWLGTLLGVKKEYAAKYEGRVKKALYSGIFCDPSKVRWWKAKLYEVIQGSGAANVSDRLLQDVANEWLEVEEEECSRCYQCGEKWPEVVAYIDDVENADCEQMHLECTTSHPKVPFRTGFEESRVMIGQ